MPLEAEELALTEADADAALEVLAAAAGLAR